MFGAPDTPRPTPPPIPEPPPSTPTYASGGSRSRPSGNSNFGVPRGGTLLTDPSSPSTSSTTRKSLLGE